ncbi:MAG: tetratricopeptide repeat protein [Steroidobacteraceae bacterium]
MTGYSVLKMSLLRGLLLVATLWVTAGALPTAAQPSGARPSVMEKQPDCRSAVEAMVLEASADRDPRRTERALDVAMACHHIPASWQMAARLWSLDPENPEALQRVGMVALQAWKIVEAREIYSSLLAKPDVEPGRALADILPPLAEGPLAPAAWRVFGTLLDRETLTPQIIATLGRMACNADDLAACASLISLARTRGGGRDARSIRLAAAAAAALGEESTALDEASLVAQGDPANHRFAEIETAITLDRFDEARDSLQKMVVADDNSPDAPFRREAERRLALLALSQGELTEAERLFSDRLRADRGSAESLYYLAVIAERQGRAESALKAYLQLSAAGAGLPPRVRAARLLFAQGRRDEALALFDALKHPARSNTIDIEIARSRALADTGLNQDAIESIDGALQRHPEHPELLYHKAVLLDGMGRSTEGIRVFESLLKLRPDEANVMNALGYTLADRKRQLARAERLIRSALAQRPDNAAYLDSLGWVLFRRGKTRDALPLLERAWRLSKEAEIAAHWGEALWASGDRTAARRVWAQALVTSPESKPLRDVIERFAEYR